MSAVDVLVLGGVGVDTIVRVGELPLPMRDSIMVPPVHDYLGHTGAGVALGCQAVGLRTRIVDFVGADPHGDLVRSGLAAKGVDFLHLIHPAGTRRGVNLVDDGGRRLSLYDGRHPADARLPADVVVPMLADARHVHLTIVDAARGFGADLGRLGGSVSTDLHDWDGDSDYHREFAEAAELVFLSTAAIAGRVTDVMRRLLDGPRTTTVVAMSGSEGSFLLTAEDEQVRHFPAVDPSTFDRSVVDSNGAGDAYVSGFLSGHLAGRPPAECALLGSIAGSYACGAAGTHGEQITGPQLAAYTAQIGRQTV